ncbi:MAG: nitroreductase family protein [Pseudomonadales bacterium]|nr:nitroreductase family protein [Pseudomonadales bacterium]
MDTLSSMLEARYGRPGSTDQEAEVNPVLATLLQHRTHRAFSDQAVQAEVLEQLLAATFSAPSKSDLQQCSLIHIQNKGKREELAGLVPTMPWVASCPEFFIFCADGRRIQRIAELRGKPFANNNLDNLIAAVCDVGIALQAFVTAAESLGLGCCPISVLRDNMEAVARIVNLPDRVIPVAGMCLGYPAREGFVSMRLPLSVTCHVDTYDDSNLPQEVDAYDQRRDARYSIPEAQQKYKKKYGIAEMYGWSEDKARQMSVPERENVGPYVRSHGFGLD